MRLKGYFGGEKVISVSPSPPLPESHKLAATLEPDISQLATSFQASNLPSSGRLFPYYAISAEIFSRICFHLAPPRILLRAVERPNRRSVDQYQELCSPSPERETLHNNESDCENQKKKRRLVRTFRELS